MTKKRSGYEDSLASGIAYLHGWVTRSIEVVAERIGVPAPELASRLGILLCGTADRTLLRAQHHLSKMRDASTKGSTAVA